MNKLLSSKILALSVLALFASESCGMQQQMMIMQQNQNNAVYCTNIVQLLPSDKQDEFRSWFANGIKITRGEAGEFLSVLGFSRQLYQHKPETTIVIRDSSSSLALWIDNNWDTIQNAQAEVNLIWPGTIEYYKEALFNRLGEDFISSLNTGVLNDPKVLYGKLKEHSGIFDNGRSEEKKSSVYIYKRLYLMDDTEEVKRLLVQACSNLSSLPLAIPKDNQSQGMRSNLSISDLEAALTASENDQPPQEWTREGSKAWNWIISKNLNKCNLTTLISVFEAVIVISNIALKINRDAKRNQNVFLKFIDDNWEILEPLMTNCEIIL